MNAKTSVLLVLKQSHICYYIICITVPLTSLAKVSSKIFNRVVNKVLEEVTRYVRSDLSYKEEISFLQLVKKLSSAYLKSFYQKLNSQQFFVGL